MRSPGWWVGAADGGGEDDLALGRDMAGLEDGPVDLAEDAAAHRRLDGGEVQVEEVGFALVDGFAEDRVGLIGRAPGDGLGRRQGAVKGLAGGGAGDDAELKGPAGGVFGLGAGREGQRNDLAGAGGGEAAEADGVFVLDEARCLIRGKGRERIVHGGIKLAPAPLGTGTMILAKNPAGGCAPLAIGDAHLARPRAGNAGPSGCAGPSVARPCAAAPASISGPPGGANLPICALLR